MADLIDRAQIAQEAAERAAFARHNQAPMLGLADCRVCGDPISSGRRAALPSAQTCIDCQTELER